MRSHKLRTDLEGGWSDLVVICAVTPWDGNRFLDQHIAVQLSRYAPVLYVDPPISHVGARRSSRAAASIEPPRLRRIGPRMARLTPLVLPLHQRPGMKLLTLALTRRMLRGAIADLGGNSVRAVIIPSVDPLFGVCGEQLKVFYVKDDFVAGAELMGVGSSSLARRQLAQPRDADIIVVASPTLAEKFGALGHKTLFLPNGCDDVGLTRTDEAPRPPDVTLPGPIAGFVGHLSERIDLDALSAVAERGRSVLLVGPRQPTFDLARLGTLLDRANVQWVGSKPYEELPSYLRMIDVGLVPYTDSDFNRASFPLKLLEYLAAGRGVVSSDLPAARWLDTPLLTIAADRTSFADAVDAALSVPRTPALVATRRAFASQHSWQARGRQLAEALGLVA